MTHAKADNVYLATTTSSKHQPKQHLNLQERPITGGQTSIYNIRSTRAPISTLTERVSRRSQSPPIKTEAPRQTGPESRVTGRETPVPPEYRRWVPPSLRPQHGLSQLDQNDTIFRKVRGILNKLTPEKFQKLSDDLLKIDLNTITILKGVIHLLFEKALDEPKYSSMYAQLCKRLSVEAPILNNADESYKFKNLLLNVCRDRFLNRSSVNHYSHGNNLYTDEEERAHIAKQKMLGNVKFIGELFKCDMLQDNILHKCIQQLLDKNRSNTIKDRCEDMECLSQLIRTCGKDLDTEKGKVLMDQYFERMIQNSQTSKYPPRIRFMLRDVIEFRQGNWIPRKVTNTEGPVPIQQLQNEEDDIIPYANRNRDPRNNEYWMNTMPLGSNDFNGLTLTTSSHFSQPYNNYSTNNYNNGYNGGNNGRGDHGGGGNGRGGGGHNGGNDGGGGGMFRHMNQRNNHNNYNNFNNHNRYNNKHNNQHTNSHNNYNNMNMMTNKDLAPRLKRISAPQENVDEQLSFRPAANSLIFKASINTNKSQLPLTSKTRPTSGASANESNNISSPMITQSSVSSKLTPPAQPVNNILNKDQILIKQASLEKPKQNKKDKGPNKEEILKRVSTFLQDCFLHQTIENERNIDDIIVSFIELKVPDKFMRDTMTLIFNEIVDKPEATHERVFDFIVSLRKDAKLNTNAILDGFKALIAGMSESSVPRIATLVASLLSRAVVAKLCKINDVSGYTENGQHYPLFLLVLQQLNKSIGKEKLTELFNDSKINLMSTLPEVDRSKERMAEILDDRSLSFLYPLLKLQGELQKQIQADPNPHQLYKWIKDNVDTVSLSDPGFITALMTVLLKYITQETTLAEGIDPTKNPDKTLTEKEKGLLEKYCNVLKAFLNRNSDLQLVAIFALQVFCHSVDFPKGMLLRWFTALYDFEVIEEESFLRWKEDLNDMYLGKGQALFQVNSYLQWLEQTESEEDDDEDVK